MDSPQQRPEFANAVTYTVAVTVTVEGGKRFGTADRRARRVAERLANTAARTPGVVEVTATAGHSHDGQVASPERVRFSEANTGHGTYSDPHTLDRFLDPDHELALRSLTEANAAYRARQQADRERRAEASCRNPNDSVLRDAYCLCVYCQPERHYDVIRDARAPGHGLWVEHRCVCGQPVALPGERFLRHRDAKVVALQGDAPALHQLAREQQADQRQSLQRQPEPERERRQEPPGPELEL